MNNQTLVREIPARFEIRIGGIFKKYGLRVQKLDRNNRGRKPDFLLTNSSNQQVIVECKYIISGGTTEDGKIISTFNTGLSDGGIFQPTFYEKYNDVFIDACDQFREFVKHNSQHREAPFVIALDADFFAKWFNFIPRDMYGLSEISAVIYLEKNVEQDRALEEYSMDELEEISDGGLIVSMPPPSVRFKVLHNSSAKVKFKAGDFLRNPIVIGR
jgi:hypothetical protein